MDSDSDPPIIDWAVTVAIAASFYLRTNWSSFSFTSIYDWFIFILYVIVIRFLIIIAYRYHMAHQYRLRREEREKKEENERQVRVVGEDHENDDDDDDSDDDDYVDGQSTPHTSTDEN